MKLEGKLKNNKFNKLRIKFILSVMMNLNKMTTKILLELKTNQSKNKINYKIKG